MKKQGAGGSAPCLFSFRVRLWVVFWVLPYLYPPELQKRFGRNTMRISQDAIRRDMLFVADGADTEALPLMMALLQYGSVHSGVVILEGILYASWYKPLFSLAKKLYKETEIHAYYFDLPFEETVRRHQTKPNCLEFSSMDMRRWWKDKDFSDILCEIPIPLEKECSQIVAEIYTAIQNNCSNSTLYS